jgi:hypothetical protein
MPPSDDFRSVTNLSRSERILLWAMRAWVVGITEKIPVEEQIQDAFNRVGAPDATGQLCAFMWILSHGANRKLNVDCVCNANISGDERSLLDIMALTQSGRTFEALILMRSMVRRETAIAASECLTKVMSALAAAGFVLRVRSLETERYILPCQTEQGDCIRMLH